MRIALHRPREAGIVRGPILRIHGGGYVTEDTYAMIPAHSERPSVLDNQDVLARALGEDHPA